MKKNEIQIYKIDLYNYMFKNMLYFIVSTKKQPY